MTLSIGEVAREAGVATSAVRYYEEVGLLGSIERVGGRRAFGEEVIPRLRLIRLLARTGFTLDEVRLLLSDRSKGRRASRDLGRRKHIEISESIENLERTRAVVEWGLRCECPSFDECTCDIHEALPGPDVLL